MHYKSDSPNLFGTQHYMFEVCLNMSPLKTHFLLQLYLLLKVFFYYYYFEKLSLELEFHIKAGTVKQSYLLFSSQNNVAMLLETNYRERVHMVTNEVKRRLDYQIALQDLNRRLEQEHMINWVEKSVISSITPQQEKESIAKCITDLKVLAKATQAKATA